MSQHIASVNLCSIGRPAAIVCRETIDVIGTMHHSVCLRLFGLTEETNGEQLVRRTTKDWDLLSCLFYVVPRVDVLFAGGFLLLNCYSLLSFEHPFLCRHREDCRRFW